MFKPQMRAICAILDLSDVKYSQMEISIFDENEVVSESRPGFNPLGYETPTLVYGGQTIIGDSPTIFKYLCMSSFGQKIDENFYPRKKVNSERKKVIDNFMEYIDSMVQRNTSRITKIVI